MRYKYLRRYTNIPALVYLLSTRTITLINPQLWDDSNDSYYLFLYREKKKLKCVLALCFTQASETYHHWRVFADGSSGVCIRFKRSELLNAMRKEKNLRTGNVTYMTLKKLHGKKLRADDLPFIKRYPFEHENEFRIIYESQTTNNSTLDITIPLSCIDRITFSPWIHKALVPHLKDMLHGIDGCGKIKIVRSTLIGNEEWKRHGQAAR